MPLIHTKQIDRGLLTLNEHAYGIYFEDAGRKGSHPINRWCRNFNRMKPLTVYEMGEKTLGYETYKRDEATLSTEIMDISGLLRQGVVVLFPLEDFAIIELHLAKSSPQLFEMLSKYISMWRSL